MLEKIIETRIMIRKSDGWIFADYVWNEDQTEADLDLNGSTKILIGLMIMVPVEQWNIVFQMKFNVSFVIKQNL